MNEYINLVIEELHTRDGWEFTQASAFQSFKEARQWILDQKPTEILADSGVDEGRDTDEFWALFDEPNGAVRMHTTVADWN